MLNFRVLLLFFFSSAFFVSNWLMDVALNCFHNVGCVYLGNGFWLADAVQVWHAMWYVSIICFIAVMVFALDNIGRK